MSKQLNLGKITTNYWIWIEFDGGGMELKCRNTESEALTLLSVLGLLFGRFLAELDEIL